MTQIQVAVAKKRARCREVLAFKPTPQRFEPWQRLSKAKSALVAACSVAFLVLVGVMSTLASVARAETTSAPEGRKIGMALPGEKCRVPPLSKWTKPEKWVWIQICEGRIADFNRRLNEELDPRNPDHDDKWSNDRRLSSVFLETILLHEPFSSAIPRQGVRISGASFPDYINLTDASIGQPLMVHKSRFKSQVDMFRLRTPALISFEGTKFDSDLNVNSILVGAHLFMRNAEFSEVDLKGAGVGGYLDMNGSTFKGELAMDSTSVSGNLFMKNGEFGEVALRGAKISRQLSMIGSTFKGALSMGSASVGGSLPMRNAAFDKVDLRGAKIGDQLAVDGSTFKGKLTMGSVSAGGSLFLQQTEFGEVDLRGAKIGGQMTMDGSTFKGKLIMPSISVGTSLFLRQVEFDSPANLMFLSVGSNLDVRVATLRGLDLTGSRIEGELRLGSSDAPKITWNAYKDENKNRQSPKLTLRNTSVGALQDTKDTWPDHLEREFEGFTYDRLGGFGASEHENPDERGSAWFIEWLAKDESYSPQPYRQLASVLRASGHEDMADNILVASRDRELGETDWWPPRWLWLWALKIFIGYGYGWGYLCALIWSAVLVVGGTITLCIAKEDDRDGIRLGFWYSLDMLLPIIHLREQHYTAVDLNTWAEYYFYVHKILGYVLISFVIAGLSGLTE